MHLTITRKPVSQPLLRRLLTCSVAAALAIAAAPAQARHRPYAGARQQPECNQRAGKAADGISAEPQVAGDQQQQAAEDHDADRRKDQPINFLKD